MCGSPFKFSLVAGQHDQKYLDRQRELSDAIGDEDFDGKPTSHGSYQYSSKLRDITRKFHSGVNPNALLLEAQRSKDATRAKPTKPKDLAALKLSKFEASSGLHEWIPTDNIGNVISSASTRWMFYFNVMRCPTWLPILTARKHHSDYQQYVRKIEEAAHYASLGPACPDFVKSSDLGLNGHSGGLSMDRDGKGAKPLTVFQADWHNELRRIFSTHSSSLNYQGWAADLNRFITESFLFSTSADDLPGLPSAGVSAQQVMQRILWDLNLSDRDEKNPLELGPSPYGMDRIAAFLHREWNSHFQLLSNQYRAGTHG